MTNKNPYQLSINLSQLSDNNISILDDDVDENMLENDNDDDDDDIINPFNNVSEPDADIDI